MIRFQKTDALHPEKQTTLILDVLPLLAFATGFVIVRSIVGNLAQPVLAQPVLAQSGVLQQGVQPPTPTR